jgi:lipopolysaccharide export system permease protein
MLKILDRYLLKELIDPFLFGLLSFTLILGASMVLFELVRAVILQGMPLLTALLLFVYKLPSIMVYIFPMATLLAALLGFARLSGNSEIVAFKASGISLGRIMIPVIILGLLISITTLLFYEIVVPVSNRSAKELIAASATRYTPRLKENILVPEIEKGTLKRIFYARKLVGDIMQGVIVQEFVDGNLSQLINAKRASWKDRKWLFEDGIIYLLSEEGEYKHLIKFKEQQIAIKYSPADLSTGDLNPEEMNIAQLSKYINLKKKMGVDVTDLAIQLNMKISIPFASLVFVLLGAPLGIRPQRTGSGVGLGLSIIVIFLYYVFTFIGMALGELKSMTPFMAAWLPNIITSGLGVYLLKQKSQ